MSPVVFRKPGNSLVDNRVVLSIYCCQAHSDNLLIRQFINMNPIVCAAALFLSRDAQAISTVSFLLTHHFLSGSSLAVDSGGAKILGSAYGLEKSFRHVNRVKESAA